MSKENSSFLGLQVAQYCCLVEKSARAPESTGVDTAGLPELLRVLRQQGWVVIVVEMQHLPFAPMWPQTESGGR